MYRWKSAPEATLTAIENLKLRMAWHATREIPLRPNLVHPLTRKDYNNNLGVHAPEIQYSFEPGGNWE